MRERAVIIASGLMAGGALGGALRRGAAPVRVVPRGPGQAPFYDMGSGVLKNRSRSSIRANLFISLAESDERLRAKG